MRLRLIARGLAVLALAAALVPAAAAGQAGGVPASDSGRTALDGSVMWIWQLRRSERGNVAALVAKAQRYGLSGVVVKGADGRQAWPQFSQALTGALHAAGLRVCAYQYVYGSHPVGEAVVAAQVLSRGADCLVIDAESQYEGRYRAAALYLRELRRRIGASYPVALTSFPYVDYHPGLPYSVFLAPGAAGINMPQMYWRAIGTSVDNVFAHTYTFNRVYERPIYPIGQLRQHPSRRSIVRFRSLADAYGARGVSWWDWQEASAAGWSSLQAPVAAPAGFVPVADYPLLRRRPRNRTKGDLVLWAQQHLVSAGRELALNGIFGVRMEREVTAFQLAHGLVATGRIDSATWRELLRFDLHVVDWSKRPAPAFTRKARASAARSEFAVGR